jgi:glycosyltransferase involved in cell wall biosynthesis
LVVAARAEPTGAGAHLAIFVRSLAGGGGAERMMVTLASTFAARGHRVDLVLGRAVGRFLDDVPSSVRIVDLGCRTILAAVPALLRDARHGAVLAPALLNASPPWVLGCIPSLARYLRRDHPDALLSALNYSNLTALYARHLSGAATRLVISERNTLSERVEREVKGRYRALPAMVRHFYPWADAVTAVSRGVAEDIAAVAGLPPESVVTTYNPVVSPQIAVRAAEPLRHPWFAPGQPPVLLGCGKLRRQKDFRTLLDAFARLRRRRVLRLVILGVGPERARLGLHARRLGVSQDVCFEGFVANPFAYMARAAAFALSSAWEGLPSVLIQAMACGCPVVSTDCRSGPSEVLMGGEYGPLVPVGDAKALARALDRILDEPPDRERLVARASHFALDEVAERYLAVLLEGVGPDLPKRAVESP